MQRALLLAEHLPLLFLLQPDHLQLLNDNILLELFLFGPLHTIGCIGLHLYVVLQLLYLVVDVPDLFGGLAFIQAVVH
jgi:hypothetical protein